MNCDQCGKKLGKKEAFCPACGAPRPAEQPAQVSLRAAGGKKKLTKKQLTIRIVTITAAVLAALAIAAVLMLITLVINLAATLAGRKLKKKQ